jgi:hypothetical protein
MSYSESIVLVPARIIQSLRHQEISTGPQYRNDPVGNYIDCKELSITCERYSENCFGQFGDGRNIFRGKRDNESFDLNIIDLRPYSPGRT